MYHIRYLTWNMLFIQNYILCTCPLIKLKMQSFIDLLAKHRCIGKISICYYFFFVVSLYTENIFRRLFEKWDVLFEHLRRIGQRFSLSKSNNFNDIFLKPGHNA